MYRILPLAASVLVVLLVTNAMSSQAPSPTCDTIVLERHFLGGGPDPGRGGRGGPPIPGEPVGYRITLDRSGNSSMHRNRFYFTPLPDSGHDFIATVDLNAFNKLCQMAEASSFQALGSSYGPTGNVADGGEITVTVTSGTKKKSVYERNGRGPAELKTFQQAVIALAESMTWMAK
jgi:hypothetical protein